MATTLTQASTPLGQIIVILLACLLLLYRLFSTQQPIECKKIFIYDTSDKGLISRIYEEHIKFNNNK